MSDTFFIIPASSKIGLVMLPVLLIMVVVFSLIAFFFGRSFHSARHATFQVNDSRLVIDGEYSRSIPLRDLDLGHARVLSLDQAGELRPDSRTNGVGLPGYRAGWFQLRNGQKALLYVTATNEVIYLPTNEGYSLLLSVIHPDAFLESLRRHSAQQP